VRATRSLWQAILPTYPSTFSMRAENKQLTWHTSIFPEWSSQTLTLLSSYRNSCSGSSRHGRIHLRLQWLRSKCFVRNTSRHTSNFRIYDASQHDGRSLRTRIGYSHWTSVCQQKEVCIVLDQGIAFRASEAAHKPASICQNSPAQWLPGIRAWCSSRDRLRPK
jgi:hypothetical protein